MERKLKEENWNLWQVGTSYMSFQARNKLAEICGHMLRKLYCGGSKCISRIFNFSWWDCILSRENKCRWEWSLVNWSVECLNLWGGFGSCPSILTECSSHSCKIFLIIGLAFKITHSRSTLLSVMWESLKSRCQKEKNNPNKWLLVVVCLKLQC